MTEWHDLSGHVALVTGGNSGIGLGMARGLRQRRRGGRDLGHQRRTQCGRCRRDTRRRRRGGCVHRRCQRRGRRGRRPRTNPGAASAGSTPASPTPAYPDRPAPIDAMTTEEWRRVMAVNLDGAFYTVRAVVGHMKTRGAGGSIVLHQQRVHERRAAVRHPLRRCESGAGRHGAWLGEWNWPGTRSGSTRSCPAGR